MKDSSPPVFGRRAPPSQAPAARAPGPPSLVGATPWPREAEDDGPRRRVPRAQRAALLAGLVVGCLYMGVALHGGTRQLQIAGLATPPLDPVVALSTIAAGGLFAGLRGAMGSLFILRVGLNALGLTDVAAYAIAGGALAAVDALVIQALGLGLPEHGLSFAALAEAATAAVFRVFAGVTRP